MTVAKPHTFTANTPGLSGEVNANFDAIFTTLGVSDYDSEHNSNGSHKAITATGITVSGNINSTAGNLNISGSTALNGSVTLGDGSSDDVTFTGSLASNIIPKTDNSVDLGSSSKEFKDLYLDGVGYIDELQGVASVDSTTTDSVFNNVDGDNADTLVGQMDAANSNTIAALRTRATGTSVGAGGVAASELVSSFSTTSNTAVDVTGASCTITTSGRPVRVMLVPSGTLQSFWTSLANVATEGNASVINILEGETVIASVRHDQQGNDTTPANQAVPTSSVGTLYFPSAGTYTYKIQTFYVLSGGSGGTSTLTNFKLVAYEL